MPFDPIAATAAYIDALGPEALARSADYTAGGHWLLFWNLVVAGVTTLAIVRSGVLERVGSRFGGKAANRRALVIGLVYFFASWLLALPWSLYADWWRERSYGRTSQSLLDFAGQGALSALVSAVMGALFFVGVYALIRRTGARWWAWSAGLSVAAIVIAMLVQPVLIEPLFNEYKPVPKGEVREALIEMAARAGVPSDRLFVYDGSRQSNNFTAKVSGFGSSSRIGISDVAFKGGSLDEVKAVTGHEIGHFAEGHLFRLVAMFSALLGFGFFVADACYPRLARVFSSKASIADAAGLPVLMFMLSAYLLLAEPLMNAVIRRGEADADDYSLRTVNLPDALAAALVKSAEYRYPRPHPLQEFLFYQHPSVERRVLAAMRWKARAVSLPDRTRIPPR